MVKVGRNEVELSSRAPEKLPQTVPGPRCYDCLPERCSALLCSEKVEASSAFSLSYTLQSYLMKLQLDRDRVIRAAI